MTSVYSYPNEIPYQKSKQIPSKDIYKISSQYPPQRSYQDYPDRPRIVHQDYPDRPRIVHRDYPDRPRIVHQDNPDRPKIVHEDNLQSVPAVPPGKKRKCNNGRILCIALLLLLLAIVLAAIVIPIVVIALNYTPSTSTCATTFSQTFISGGTPTSQCIVWGAFTAGLTCSSYSLMRISGTNDPTGLTVTSPAIATGIALALRGNTTYSAVSNGYTWNVGACGTPYQITATGGGCSCTAGYTIRPCIGSSSWGGLNGATCGAATQTMTLYFE